MESHTDWMDAVRKNCEQLRARFPAACSLLSSLHQPLTPRQGANRNCISLDRSCYLFWLLASRHLVECLNRDARKSRLYWLTLLGSRCQARLRREDQLPRLDHDFPQVDWTLYGWVCHRHRSAVVKETHEPLHPVTIKRRASQRDERLRMSANNVRDVLRVLLARGIVERITDPRDHHPRYCLTSIGHDLRRLLMRAESPLTVGGGQP